MSKPALDIAELARVYYADVFRFCARRIGPDLAADAAQETFLTAQRASASFRAESTVRTWLLGIAMNECRRQLRQKSRSEVPLSFEREIPSHEGIAIDRHVLKGAMEKLTAEMREVVVLHELDQLTYGEIAEILGVPVGTVKSRLHHAFVQLRRSVFGAPIHGQVGLEGGLS